MPLARAQDRGRNLEQGRVTPALRSPSQGVAGGKSLLAGKLLSRWGSPGGLVAEQPRPARFPCAQGPGRGARKPGTPSGSLLLPVGVPACPSPATSLLLRGIIRS